LRKRGKEIKQILSMPKFKGIPDASNQIVKTSILYGLLEKTCFFSELSKFHNPFINKFLISELEVFGCFSSNTFSISVFGENKLILHLYQFSAEKSRKICVFVYAYFILKNESNQYEIHSNQISFSQKPFLYCDNPPLIPLSMRSFFTKKGVTFQLEIIKNVLLVILQKSEHRGFTGMDIQHFIQSSSFRFLSRLHYIVKIEIPRWIHTKIWIQTWSHCSWKNMVFPRYNIETIFFNSVPHFKGTPCQNCPVQTECSPQGSINPFECIYLTTWEKKSSTYL